MSGLKLSSKLALPVDVVTEAMGIVATRGAGKSYASAVLIEEAFRAGVQTVVVDVTGVYHGLRSNAAGDGPGLAIYVFGGQHGDLPLETNAGSFMGDLVVDSGQSFVLDLSDFLKGKARQFVADFLDRLYSRKARDRATLLLVVDEADEFAPQKPRGESAFSLAAMETIAKRGRSRGIGIVMITQRTQALNKDVLDLIETLIAMRQLAERSRDAVQGWIADKELRDESGVIASLQALPTGTAWVWSPLRGILEKVAIRRIKTFDSYQTPKPGHTPPEPGQRKELDLDKLGEQMSATVERAKQNDPKELRRMNHELQKRLAAAEQSIEQLRGATSATETLVEEVVKEIEVPVPVFGKGEVEKLADVVSELDRVAGVVGDLVSISRDLSTAARGIEDAVSIAARDVAARVRRSEEPRRPVRPVPPRPAPQRADVADGNGGPQGDLTGPEQRVLDAIRWYGELGYAAPTKQQVGFIAGYRVGKKVGGTYGNILGSLRSRELVSYPGGGVALTDAGSALARDAGLGYTNRDLQDAVMQKLDGPERRVLANLIELYPDGISKQELGARSGYTVGDKVGGTFGNILGRLRSLGLIDYPQPGTAAALPVLFPEGG